MDPNRNIPTNQHASTCERFTLLLRPLLGRLHRGLTIVAAFKFEMRMKTTCGYYP